MPPSAEGGPAADDEHMPEAAADHVPVPDGEVAADRDDPVQNLTPGVPLHQVTRSDNAARQLDGMPVRGAAGRPG